MTHDKADRKNDDGIYIFFNTSFLHTKTNTVGSLKARVKVYMTIFYAVSIIMKIED